ncbi:MAG: hypothetical protein NTU62_10840, partial [Spirochaetes bacterium]|nr:hypothetical protein [Spirochaetota bacterium]
MKSLVTLILLAVLTGCAGVPGLAAPPDWVGNPPGPDAANTFFTGVGTSRGGDRAEAEEIARADLLDGIMRYLGVKVTTETTAVAKASVDDYRTEVRQQLTQEGAGRIAGLTVKDRYVEKGKAGVTVYLLARYVTADLEREKRRLEEVFREQQEAVAGPEREGAELEQAGRLYEAALKYLEAATAASKSDIDNAAIKFERAINEARTALERISLLKLNDNLRTPAGAAFAEPFRVKAAGGAKPADPGVPEVALAVSWADWRTGKRQVASARVKTAADGVAAFVHPAPEFVGAETVTMGIDIAPYLEGFGKLTKDQQGMVDGLEDVAARKRVTFSLESYSLAREIETAIAVTALDAAGSPLGGQDFPGGVLKALNAAKFRVKALVLDPAVVSGSADAEVIAAASKKAGATTRRIVYGTARVEGTEADSGMFVAKVSGSVKVADVKTAEV